MLGHVGLTAAGLTLPASARLAAGTTFGSIRTVRADPLRIAFVDLGPPDGTPVILLHGWPYDVHAFAEAAPILATEGYRVIVPYLRGFGDTVFLTSDEPRNGQQAVLARDVISLMDALRIEKAIIAGFDWGARSACIVAALWPERCRALVSVSGYLIGSQRAGQDPLPPEAELSWWYQFYFASERGRAGYETNRHAFNRLIWRLASPKWSFDEATYDRSARSFDNPDHVAIVIHNYRWRLGLADNDPTLDDAERHLSISPNISIPTITLEGDANGAPHPQPQTYRARFAGPYEHRLVRGGIGHALPQEAPRPFADAVLDAGGLR